MDIFKKKPAEENANDVKDETISEKEENTAENSAPVSDVICSACNQPGADKKFAGQHWHKKCLRKMRKMAKGMF